MAIRGRPGIQEDPRYHYVDRPVEITLDRGAVGKPGIKDDPRYHYRGKAVNVDINKARTNEYDASFRAGRSIGEAPSIPSTSTKPFQQLV